MKAYMTMHHVQTWALAQDLDVQGVTNGGIVQLPSK